MGGGHELAIVFEKHLSDAAEGKGKKEKERGKYGKISVGEKVSLECLTSPSASLKRGGGADKIN